MNKIKFAKRCQMTMSDDGKFDGRDHTWECGRPAKFWIPDPWKRKAYMCRLLLCGLHARAHDKVAKRFGRPTSTPLQKGENE